ncbi:alpha-ketoacid dehydrogenase subunit beta [Patescibacteria group bacterium]|nr:alpha-ketoacid dehydrogenase subunit beta [Patescibacteria group bacterium]
MNKKHTITYREAINLAIAQEMRRDKNVFLYGLDVTDHKRIFGSTKGLLEEFGPKRCFATPLSEDAMTGVGVGAALTGLKPIFVHIRTDFLFLCLNQIANVISSYRYLSGGRVKIPLVIRAIMGRGWGQGAQHSKSIHALLAHLPGIKVVMPTQPADAKGLLVSAIRDANPVIVLEHRWLYDTIGIVPEDENFAIPIGEPHRLRQGKDLTIVATSWMNIEALQAADIMQKKQGVSMEIIDSRSISPLNYDLIYQSVRKTGHLIVTDYDWLYCGFAAEVVARVTEKCFSELKSPVSRIGFAPTPTPTARSLEDAFYPNAISIIKLVEQKLKLPKTNLSGETFYSYENKFKGPF